MYRYSTVMQSSSSSHWIWQELQQIINQTFQTLAVLVKSLKIAHLPMKSVWMLLKINWKRPASSLKRLTRNTMRCKIETRSLDLALRFLLFDQKIAVFFVEENCLDFLTFSKNFFFNSFLRMTYFLFVLGLCCSREFFKWIWIISLNWLYLQIIYSAK